MSDLLKARTRSGPPTTWTQVCSFSFFKLHDTDPVSLLGGYDKVAQTGGLNNRYTPLIVPEAGESEMQVQTTDSRESSLLGLETAAFLSARRQSERETLSSSYKDLNPITRVPPSLRHLKLITSQGPHFQGRSHQGLQHMNLEARRFST